MSATTVSIVRSEILLFSFCWSDEMGNNEHPGHAAWWSLPRCGDLCSTSAFRDDNHCSLLLSSTGTLPRLRCGRRRRLRKPQQSPRSKHRKDVVAAAAPRIINGGLHAPARAVETPTTLYSASSAPRSWCEPVLGRSARTNPLDRGGLRDGDSGLCLFSI